MDFKNILAKIQLLGPVHRIYKIGYYHFKNDKIIKGSDGTISIQYIKNKALAVLSLQPIKLLYLLESSKSKLRKKINLIYSFPLHLLKGLIICVTQPITNNSLQQLQKV